MFRGLGSRGIDSVDTIINFLPILPQPDVTPPKAIDSTPSLRAPTRAPYLASYTLHVQYIQEQKRVSVKEKKVSIVPEILEKACSIKHSAKLPDKSGTLQSKMSAQPSPNCITGQTDTHNAKAAVAPSHPHPRTAQPTHPSPCPRAPH